MEQSKGKALRQKAVSILYLIFLSLIFMMLPSDFIDSIFKVDRTYEQYQKDANLASGASNVYTLYMMSQSVAAYDALSEKITAIDHKTSEIQAYIDSLKNELIRRKGLLNTGFPKEGPSDAAAQEYMIRYNKADSLYQRLRNYATDMKGYLAEKDRAFLDSFFGKNDVFVHANGKTVNFSSFFFEHNPLNSTLLNLTHLRSITDQVKKYTITQMLESTLTDKSLNIPEDRLKLMQLALDENISLPEKLEQLRQLLKKAPAPSPSKTEKPPLSVESLSDSIYEPDKLLTFKANFDPNNGGALNVRIQGPKKTEQIRLNTPGLVRYLPEEAGTYRMTFTQGEQTLEKTFRIGDVRDVLEHQNQSVIYCSEYNAIKINNIFQKQRRVLQAEVSRGRVIEESGSIYLWVNDPGPVTLSVYEQYQGGRLKIAEKQFIARNRTAPYATIGIFKDGTLIETDDLREQKSLVVRSEIPDPSETFSIISFDCILMFGEKKDQLWTYTNYGNVFEANLREALKKLNPGDILMIRNITAKSNKGKDTLLNSIVIQLK